MGGDIFMKRSPLLPFGIIMVVGVLVMFLISFKGIGDSRDLAAELEGGNEQTDEVAANPEEIYKKHVLAAMGINIKVVESRLNRCWRKIIEEEIEDIVVNGRMQCHRFSSQKKLEKWQNGCQVFK